MRRFIALVPALAAGIVLIAGPPAGALTIDNFEEGGFLVVDTGINDLLPPLVEIPSAVGRSAEQSGLSSSNVVGGVRLISSVATNPAGELPDLSPELGELGIPLPIAPPTAIPATATAELTLPGLGGEGVDSGVQFAALGGGTFRLIYDGVAGGTESSASDGALGIDLSLFSHIELSALGVTGEPPENPAQVRLALSDSLRTRPGSFIDVVEDSILLPLSEFGRVDLTEIQQILIDIRGISTESQFQLTNVQAIPEPIQAVPEPGTALLLFTGLTALAIRGRTQERKPTR